jgi:tetratricopeptide (TPR) repeat protein
MNEQSLEVLEALHATLERDRDRDDEQRNLAAHRLAWLYVDRGETARGVDLLQQVYESSLRVHGAEDPVTLNDLGSLARALLHDEKPEQAEQLLTAVLDAQPTIGDLSLRTGLFTLRGSARLDSGRRDEACDDFYSADIADASYNDQFQAALGLHAAGDQQLYQKLCMTMLDRARELMNPVELQWVAWACALGTSHGDRDPDVLTLAENLAALQPDRREALLPLGAIQYRQGDYERAVQTLLASDASPSSEVTCDAYPWFFLALACHRLGNETEAEKWRQQALEYSDRYFNDTPEYISWTRRKSLELLRAELEHEFAPTAEVGP